jgi:hypothetical protein
MVLALLSKESGYIFPFLLPVLRRNSSLRRILILAMFFIVAAIEFVHRWSALHGLGGYPQHLTLLSSLNALALRIWAVLYFPINWSAAPSRFFGIVIALYVVALVWLAKSQTRRLELAFPFGLVIIATLPALAQLLIGPDLQKARYLYIASVGLSLMLAMAVDGAPMLARRIAPVVILAFHLLALQHNLTAWQRAGDLAKRTCVAAAKCTTADAALKNKPQVPDSVDGVYVLRVGFLECVEMNAGASAVTNGRLEWDNSRQELRCESEHR